MKNKAIAELKRIALEHGGLLKPEIVVDEARPKSSPLHSRFDWDNSSAAEKYRIWQARQLIAVSVELLAGTDEKMDVFVSLTTDRKEGGYRIMSQVLSDTEMREQMLDDALAELELFRDKYRRLKELSEVFTAIRKVKKKR